MFYCLRKCTVAQGKGWPLPSHSPPGQPEPGGGNEEPECLSFPLSQVHTRMPGPAQPFPLRLRAVSTKPWQPGSHILLQSGDLRNRNEFAHRA